MKVIDWSIFTVFHFFKKSVFVNRGKKKVLSFVFVLVLVYECYSFCSFCFSCFPFFFVFAFRRFWSRAVGALRPRAVRAFLRRVGFWQSWTFFLGKILWFFIRDMVIVRGA